LLVNLTMIVHVMEGMHEVRCGVQGFD
jgi:hypothetical protein